MNRISLTQKQQLVMDFIHHYIQENRCSPLIREIQSGCQITSYKSALDRLNALEHKGLIKRASNKHRGITLRRAVSNDTAIQALDAQPAVTAGIPA